MLENTPNDTDPDGILRAVAVVEGRAGARGLLVHFGYIAPALSAYGLARLCLRPFRAEASAGRQGNGSAPDLSICQAIVETHGGHDQ